MRITNSQLGPVFQVAQRAEIASQGLMMVTPRRAKSNTMPSTKCRAAHQVTSRLRGSDQRSESRGGEETRGSGNSPGLASRVMKYAFGAVGVIYLYDKMANDFFLSTTSLHDGKGGFSSDARLTRAEKQAEEYYQVHCSLSDEEKNRIASHVKAPGIVGANKFASMMDYRAATKVHIKNLVNTVPGLDTQPKTRTTSTELFARTRPMSFMVVEPDTVRAPPRKRLSML
ncbi:hypothetical protein [Bradyrhizobium sp. USDA 10063]